MQKNEVIFAIQFRLQTVSSMKRCRVYLKNTGLATGTSTSSVTLPPPPPPPSLPLPKCIYSFLNTSDLSVLKYDTKLLGIVDMAVIFNYM